jgi:hypothetical protein
MTSLKSIGFSCRGVHQVTVPPCAPLCVSNCDDQTCLCSCCGGLVQRNSKKQNVPWFHSNTSVSHMQALFCFRYIERVLECVSILSTTPIMTINRTTPAKVVAVVSKKPIVSKPSLSERRAAVLKNPPTHFTCVKCSKHLPCSDYGKNAQYL